MLSTARKINIAHDMKFCGQRKSNPYHIDFGKTDLKKYLSILNLKNFAQKLALKVLISKKRSSLWFWVVNCSQLALETLFVRIQTAWITNCDWSTQLLRNEPSCKKGCTSLLQNTHVKSISYIKRINIKQLLKLFLKSSFCFVFVYFPNALSDSLFVSFTFFCLCLLSLGQVFATFATFFYSFRRLPKYSKLMYFNDLSCLQEFYFATFFCFTRNFLLQLLSIFAQNVKVWFKKTCCKLFQFCPILFNCITTSYFMLSRAKF